MSDGAPTSASPLGSLRWKLTALIAGLTAAVVVLMSGFAIAADQRARDQQIESALLRATEAAASAVGFSEGELVVARQDIDLGGAGIALAARGPRLDESAPLLRDYVADFDSLTDDQVRPRLTQIIAGLPTDSRRELAVRYGTINRRDLADAILADPPTELMQELRRRYVAERAQLDGLGNPGVELVSSALPFDGAAGEVLGALEAEMAGQDLGALDFAPGYDLRTVSLRDGLVTRGAALVAVDREPFETAHQQLRNRVVVAALVIVVLGSVGAFFVAGRAIQPAAQALEQQERFLADAAHELRTPIAAIRATAERGAGPDGDERSSLERIVELAEDAGTLTDDLLTLAQMDAGALPLDRRALRLDLLVEAVVDGRQEFALDLDEVTVQADPALVERVIVNLVENAVHHGGASADTPAQVIVRADGMEVADDGPGLGPVDRAQLFDRFATGSGDTGHGLGLALSLWIAEAHGWTLSARDNPAGGAVFRLDLDG